MQWFKISIFAFIVSGNSLWAGPSPSPAPSVKKQTDKPAASKNSIKDDESKNKNPADFDIPVPEGMPVYGIKIPRYDEKGKLSMILEAEVAKRLDNQRVEMENLKIDAYDDDGKKIYIELPRSIFNLENRILTGDKHALIRREDFEITGNAIEFNTKTRHSTIRGNIKMIIFTADNL